MKVRILKGREQIGGCVTEITSDKGTRIIIDFGEDLPDKEKIKKDFEIEGLTKGNKSYDAVFITHSHGDHISSINKILETIDVYIEEKSFNIYEKSLQYTRKTFDENFKIEKENYIKFKYNSSIFVKDIKVTPYIIDHSAFNSSMFLIECDGKRILHTGDFRTHGRKPKSLENAIKEIKNVDCLITEGTSLGNNSNGLITEEQLYLEAKDLFYKYNQVFILQTSTNIDRIVSFYKAKGKKAFIMDAATCDITSCVGETIPSFGKKIYGNLFSYKPIKYVGDREKIYNKKFSKRKFNFKGKRDFIMLVKSSMLKDIESVIDTTKKVLFVYSMWTGYMTDKEKFKSTVEFIEEIKKINIDFKILHTSGHANNETLRMLDEMLNYPKVIVVHTKNNEKANEVFKNNINIKDYEEVEI